MSTGNLSPGSRVSEPDENCLATDRAAAYPGPGINSHNDRLEASRGLPLILSVPLHQSLRRAGLLVITITAKAEAVSPLVSPNLIVRKLRISSLLQTGRFLRPLAAEYRSEGATLRPGLRRERPGRRAPLYDGLTTRTPNVPGFTACVARLPGADAGVS